MDYLGLIKDEKDNLLDLEVVRQMIKDLGEKITEKGVE